MHKTSISFKKHMENKHKSNSGTHALVVKLDWCSKHTSDCAYCWPGEKYTHKQDQGDQGRSLGFRLRF